MRGPGFFFLGGAPAAAPRRPVVVGLRFGFFFFLGSGLGFLFLPIPMTVPLRRASGVAADLVLDRDSAALEDRSVVLFAVFFLVGFFFLLTTFSTALTKRLQFGSGEFAVSTNRYLAQF